MAVLLVKLSDYPSKVSKACSQVTLFTLDKWLKTKALTRFKLSNKFSSTLRFHAFLFQCYQQQKKFRILTSTFISAKRKVTLNNKSSSDGRIYFLAFRDQSLTQTTTEWRIDSLRVQGLQLIEPSINENQIHKDYNIYFLYHKKQEKILQNILLMFLVIFRINRLPPIKLI